MDWRIFMGDAPLAAYLSCMELIVRVLESSLDMDFTIK
jgi:hypothetical protein